MPLIAAVAALLLVVLAAIALLPLSLIQRYRVGTARRPARDWVITLNLLGISLSVALFLAGAALTNVWVPNAFNYTLIGLSAGCLLGLCGLALTTWEPSPRFLHYTPNRWLVLIITVVVTARVAYGFWRSWHAWRAALDHAEWLAASGVAGSLGAGAVVLGYYLVYWAGVRRRIRRYKRTQRTIESSPRRFAGRIPERHR